MATRLFTPYAAPGGGDIVVWGAWTGLLNGDDGETIEIPEHVDLTVHIFGTLGVGGSISLRGTNEVTGVTNEVVLNDSRGSGNPITITAVPAARQVLEVLKRIRPIVTAGDGSTNFSVALKATRSR